MKFSDFSGKNKEAVSKQNLGRSFFLQFSPFFEQAFCFD
jgi:hypothetical protein